MHNLVLWGFALAVIPLLAGIVWEFVVLSYQALSRPTRKIPAPPDPRCAVAGGSTGRDHP